MNKDNYKKVLDQIIAHPETWNQTGWHCGTTHCFAGWAQLLSGKPENVETVLRDARVYLNLSRAEAEYIFAPSRTVEDFSAFRNGYDCDGYNCAGYDRDGYDRDGYDCDGYDCDGLNRNNQPQQEVV